MHSAVLAMVLYPAILKRAQEEIDLVIGNERLPTFEDKALLPYVEGIVREANRCALIMWIVRCQPSLSNYVVQMESCGTNRLASKHFRANSVHNLNFHRDQSRKYN